MIKFNSGTPGVMHKAANGSLAAITLLDTNPITPTSRLWSISFWPDNIASAPAVTSATSNPATFTPPAAGEWYVVRLTRTVGVAEFVEELPICIPDATGTYALPCPGIPADTDPDLTIINLNDDAKAIGWAGGLRASLPGLSAGVRKSIADAASAVSAVAPVVASVANRKIYNIVDYGADPGNTDNRTQIQACIDAANAANPKGTIYVPTGVFKVNSFGGGSSYTSTCLLLKDGVAWRGNGPGSVIKAADGLSTSAQPWILVGNPATSFTSNDIDIEGVTFDGSGNLCTGAGEFGFGLALSAIRIAQGSNVRLRNIGLKHFHGSSPIILGTYTPGDNNPLLTDVLVDSLWLVDIANDETGNLLDHSSIVVEGGRIVVTNCIAYAQPTGSDNPTKHACFIETHATELTVSNNVCAGYLTGCNVGFDTIHSYSSTFVGNTWDSVVGFSFFHTAGISAQGCVIIGNTIITRKNGINSEVAFGTGGSDSAFTSTEGLDVQIIGNHCHYDGTSSPIGAYGAFIRNNLQGGRFFGNTFLAYSTAAIFLQPNLGGGAVHALNDVEIADNLIRDCGTVTNGSAINITAGVGTDDLIRRMTIRNNKISCPAGGQVKYGILVDSGGDQVYLADNEVYNYITAPEQTQALGAALLTNVRQRIISDATYDLQITGAIRCSGVNITGATAGYACVFDGSKNISSLRYSTTNVASTLVQRDSNGTVDCGALTCTGIVDKSTAGALQLGGAGIATSVELGRATGCPGNLPSGSASRFVTLDSSKNFVTPLSGNSKIMATDSGGAPAVLAYSQAAGTAFSIPQTDTNNTLTVSAVQSAYVDTASAVTMLLGAAVSNKVLFGRTGGVISLFDAGDAVGQGGGVGVLSWRNATTAPTTNPTNGVIMSVGAGEFFIRTPSGNVVKVANNAPPAYTQTFSTATHTNTAYTADDESAAYTGQDNLQAGTVYAKVADLNALRVAYENLRAQSENNQKLLNGIIDDLRAKGDFS